MSVMMQCETSQELMHVRDERREGARTAATVARADSDAV
jgi:hypothetical protein